MKSYEEILEQIERLKERIERCKNKTIVMFPRLEQEMLNNDVIELRTLMWVVGYKEYKIDDNIEQLFMVGDK